MQWLESRREEFDFQLQSYQQLLADAGIRAELRVPFDKEKPTESQTALVTLVKESLESRVAAFNLQDKIGRVMIPMEEFVEVRGGKKVVSPRMSYPGYVLVEMDLDDNTWHIVRSTPRVTGFVGSAISPSPLSDAEVDAIINRVHVPTDRPKPKVVFERNEQVRIVDGPFANFNGSVEEIDNDHSRLKVSVTIFGRSTPVELDFASVEKLG